MLLVGCKAPPGRVTKTGTEPKPPPRQGTVETGTAEITKFIDEPERHKAWKLQWVVAKINLKEGFRPEGELDNVDATIYDREQGVTTVHADKGVTERASPLLSLQDNVTAISRSRDARLTCNALKWDPQRRIIIATGNVRYHWQSLDAGPFPEVWASPDMERFGTPDTFKIEGTTKK